jgi:uncharacterized repeat protein (TIGR03803 family)
MSHPKRILAPAVLLALAVSTLLTLPAWGAAGSKVLYSFAGAPDGANPYASLIFDSAGNLYGTTEFGGAYGGGTAFELSQANGFWTETVLHSFGGTADGYEPESSLVFDKAGNLYGTTWQGGTYGSGSVYELSPNGDGTWAETVLYNFNCCDPKGDGFNPNSAVFLGANGKIYGTTENGGAAPQCNAINYGCGTFFELTHTPNGWKETILYSYGEAPDSSLPWGNLTVDKAGNFYDTSIWGGSQSYAGTVFELTPTSGGGWTNNVIYTLDQQTGVGMSNEVGGVVFDSSGNLYGVGVGGVFELSPSSSGWTETTLYAFSSNNGPYNPNSSVVLVHNTVLWGTTPNGGGGTCNSNGGGCGTLYRLQKINGVWTPNALFHFRNQADGWYPAAKPVLDSSGNVYGTTLNGGAYGYGVVYEVTP